MGMMDSLRKGFRFFLMSLGISSPQKKPVPRPTLPPDSPK